MSAEREIVNRLRESRKERQLGKLKESQSHSFINPGDVIRVDEGRKVEAFSYLKDGDKVSSGDLHLQIVKADIGKDGFSRVKVLKDYDAGDDYYEKGEVLDWKLSSIFDAIGYMYYESVQIQDEEDRLNESDEDEEVCEDCGKKLSECKELNECSKAKK